MKPDDLRKFIYWWNNSFPYDRWWRKKYNIPFNSLQHQEQSPIDTRLEFEEDRVFRALEDQQKKDDLYTPGMGSWLNKQKVQPMSQKEIEDTFDNIDLSAIGDDGSILIN